MAAIRRSPITGEPAVPVLYLDIDGTVRWGKDELGHFVNEAKDVRVYDEVPALLAQYKELGYRIVGVSNQGGIALGYMDVMTCADAMVQTNHQCDNLFDRLAWCSHHPNANDPAMAVCWCRKPRPGLVIEAALSLAEQHKEIYPVHMGLFVGDMDSDRQCAENAALSFMDAKEWRAGKHLKEIFDAQS